MVVIAAADLKINHNNNHNVSHHHHQQQQRDQVVVNYVNPNNNIVRDR